MNSIKGLSSSEVLESRKKYGSNEITSSKSESIFSLIIESLNDPIIKILLIALLAKILFFLKDSDIYEMIGIIVAIIVATLISSLSEYASSKAFEKLSMSSSKIITKVIRDSKLKNIPIEEIVVNDYVYIESGDKVPADGYVYKDTIAVDESMLTGETKEQYKNKNDLVYKGSIVLNGSAIIKINQVGSNTYYGKIAKYIEEKPPVSPLKERLKVLAGTISKLGYICAFLVMFSYLFSVIVLNNNISNITNVSFILPHLLYSLTLGITIIVMAVPEGLPMMITLVLSSNMKRLVKNNVLVRKLVGIESSGSLNILYTDKTGTITKGKLEVSAFVDSSKKEYKNYIDINGKIKEILDISLIYNNSSNIANDEIIGGNSTDRAIMDFVKNSDRSKYKVLNKKDFNSKDKYSSVTINYDKEITLYKGAYEIIIDNCSFCYKRDGTRTIIKSKNELIINANQYTKKGYRVIALATGRQQMESLTFLGLLLIKDEIRKEAFEGIRMVSEAGVQTVMITGDNELTATSIAKEVGLITSEKDIVITSNRLNSMNDDEVKKIIPNLKVVARSLPEDKKRLVVLSEELGLVTGMTGDGVNDAPALKKADVGFAMGSGSEVAKEVSDIIVLDDNFLSIGKAILFGRTIFKSIRKFIIFQLTVNLTAVSLSVIGPFFGIIAPVTVVQMLWINMIMDTLAGIAYAFEPPLKDYMKEKPKRRDEKIMNSYMINEILFTGGYICLILMFFLKSSLIKNLYRSGPADKYLMTAFFGLFIFINVFNAFNARTYRLNVFANLLKNKVFLAIIMFIVMVQILMIYFGGSIFRTTGLSFFELDITIILALTVLPVDFIRKKILKKFKMPLGV